MPRELNEHETELLALIDTQVEQLQNLIRVAGRLHSERLAKAHTEPCPAVTFEQLADGATTAGLAEDHLRTGIMYLRKAVLLDGEW